MNTRVANCGSSGDAPVWLHHLSTTEHGGYLKKGKEKKEEKGTKFERY